MPFQLQQHPYFILLLDINGEIVKVHHHTKGLFDKSPKHKLFSDLIDKSALLKSTQFFNKIYNEGVALDWELSYSLNDKIEVMTTSGFKTDNNIHVIANGRLLTSQVMYDEMTLINNEQLNSIRMLRKQLNQMAAEYTKIQGELNKEIENLRQDLNKCRESLPA